MECAEARILENNVRTNGHHHIASVPKFQGVINVIRDGTDKNTSDNVLSIYIYTKRDVLVYRGGKQYSYTLHREKSSGRSMTEVAVNI